jgi:ribosomal protein L7/L12
VVSYSVFVATVVVTFVVAFILGRHNSHRRVVWKSAGDAATGAKVIEVPLGEGSQSAIAPLTPSTTEAARDPVLRGHLEREQLIEAIKRYRELTGVGLKEAKEAVEALRRQQ